MRIKFFALLLVSVFIASGCKAGAKNLTNMAILPSPALNELESGNDTAKERAEKIADEIKKIKEVEHASVVITGNTAIIGLVLYGEPGDDEIIDLKRVVEKNVKSFDKEIDHVAVSASAELYERLMKLGGSKSQQEEDKLHENDGNELFFRMTPSM